MDREYDDLTVPPPEAFSVPAAAAPAIAGVSGQLPQKVGGVIRPEYLSDKERKTLEALGWKAGDPIPTDMANRLGPEIEAAQLDASKEYLEPPVAENTPAMTIPQETPISSLPPERQAELKQALEQAKLISEQNGIDANPFASALNIDQEVELIDDTRPAAAAQPAAQPTEAKPAAPAAGNATGVDSPVMGTGICPQCNHDLSMPAIPDPSEDDRRWYLQSVLGVVPFEKPYLLLGGQLEVVFRELDFAVLEAIYTQVRNELLNKPATESDYRELIERYRVSTQLVRFGIGKAGTQIPKFDPTAMTLPKLSEAVVKALKNVSTYRIVRMQLTQFKRLIAKQEACATNENFWPAVTQT